VSLCGLFYGSLTTIWVVRCQPLHLLLLCLRSYRFFSYWATVACACFPGGGVCPQSLQLEQGFLQGGVGVLLLPVVISRFLGMVPMCVTLSCPVIPQQPRKPSDLVRGTV